MGSEMTDGEKIAKFEAQLENLVVLVTKLDAKIDAWQSSFVSKELLDEMLKSRDEKIERLENEKASHKGTLPLWAAAVISGIALIVSLWPK